MHCWVQAGTRTSRDLDVARRHRWADHARRFRLPTKYRCVDAHRAPWLFGSAAKAKGGQYAKPGAVRDVELRGEEVGRFNSCPMVIDTRAPQTERRNQVAPCPRYRLAATPLSLQGHRLECVASRLPEAGVAGAARRFLQKLGAVGLGAVTDIAGERCAAEAGGEHDGAVVERGVWTMADADDGRVLELAHQALH